MSNLFKNKAVKTQRAYRVENLNAKEGIFASMRVSKDQREYVVCLCMPTKTTKTTFKCETSALDQLNKYKELYKEK